MFSSFFLNYDTFILMDSFGERIKNGRKAKGWSQEQLARILKRKCSGSYISQIEKYGKIPSDEFILDISKSLGLDAYEMLKLACKKSKPKVYEAFSGAGHHPSAPSCYHSKKEYKAIETAKRLSDENFNKWIEYADWLIYKKTGAGKRDKEKGME